MSQCRSCQAEIMWVVTEKGRRMPVNASPDPMGNVVLRHGPDRTFAVVLGKGEETDERRFMPHHATCPSVDQHRRK